MVEAHRYLAYAVIAGCLLAGTLGLVAYRRGGEVGARHDPPARAATDAPRGAGCARPAPACPATTAPPTSCTTSTAPSRWGSSLSPWFYAPAGPAQAAALVRRLGARRGGPRRSWHHDRAREALSRKPNRPRARDRGADRASRRRPLTRAGARRDRRPAANRLLPRDRVLPVPRLARAPWRPRGVDGASRGGCSTVRSGSPSSTSALRSGSRRRAATRSRSSSCSACCAWAIVRTWRAEHVYRG